MDQRHKDIIKRLRAAMNGYHGVEINVKSGLPVEVRITNKALLGKHIEAVSIIDLLAIARNVDIEEQCTGHKETLSSLVHLIESAGGASKLSYAVELGQISWYAKMESALNHAKAILNEEETND